VTASHAPPARRDAAFDALLYGASALAAGGVWLFADIPIQRTWGRISVGPYVAAALVAALLARRHSNLRARVALAALLFVAVAALPMALEITWRARTSPGLHAQSEVIVTEEAARATLDGRDPYAADYSNGPLRARPGGTRTHFPYLPAMLLFGVPRALGGSSGWADARLGFALVTLACAAFVVGLWPGASSERRLRFLQVFLVVPTSALLMATSGDDLPVLGLMLLAVVLASRGNALEAVVVCGLAAAMKQTAWLFVPFLIVAAVPEQDHAPRVSDATTGSRRAAVVAVISAAFIVPFLLWSPSAFVEDVVKFPLGLGRQRSAAGTTTLGSLLVRAFASARVEVTALIVASMIALVIVLLRAARSAEPYVAARLAGLAFLATVVLAPAGRVGYLVYPLNLLTTSALLRRERTSALAVG
jgi:hypothetical protein